jgi:hypothetical protein
MRAKKPTTNWIPRPQKVGHDALLATGRVIDTRFSTDPPHPTERLETVHQPSGKHPERRGLAPGRMKKKKYNFQKSQRTEGIQNGHFSALTKSPLAHRIDKRRRENAVAKRARKVNR